MIFISGCASSQEPEEPTEVQVAAASSLQPVFHELEEEIENHIDNIDVVFQFGGSGALQRQIEQGAPFDIFFSASEADFAALLEAEKINPEQSMDLLGNKLVLIKPAATETPIANLEELAHSDIETIAIGTPESVPAGKFAQETLENLQMWGILDDKIVQARSARQILTYNETNNVDAGFVFATDAASSEDVETVEKIDTSLHRNIIYPLGIIEETDQPEAALEVYNFLVSDEAKAVYEAYGYEVTIDE